MAATVDKVDMSLDDIIKLNRKTNKQQRGGGSGRGRGTGRGMRRGRGVARGMAGLKVGSLRGWSSDATGQNNQTTVRGRFRGRGQRRGMGRAGQINKGISPLNRQQDMETDNNANVQTSPKQQQRLRGGFKRGTFSKKLPLAERKKLALINLQNAQQTLRTLNEAGRQIHRQDIVDKNRGIQTNTLQSRQGNQQNGRFQGRQQRGRGRGRKQGVVVEPVVSPRRLSTNKLSINNAGDLSDMTKKQRKWRQNNEIPASNTLTVSVDNVASSRQLNQRFQKLNRVGVNSVTSPSSLQQQIANLKPKYSQKYNFNKSYFSHGNTAMTLNDRFSGGSISGGGSSLGRQVFL